MKKIITVLGVLMMVIQSQMNVNGAEQGVVSAGFGKANINPPNGSPMYGWLTRDRAGRTTGIHDSLFVRVVYLNDGENRVLLITYDLCSLYRAECDRIKGMLGRYFDILPKDIVINYSHTHNGPKTSTELYPDVPTAGDNYFFMLEERTKKATEQAISSSQKVTLSYGIGKSHIPISRRFVDKDGKVQFAPSQKGEIDADLPLMVAKNDKGEIVAAFFSIACHPTTYSSYEVSADFVGAALDELEKKLGNGNFMLLQGCGADAKPNLLNGTTFRYPGWEFLKKGGEIVAADVLDVLKNQQLKTITPKFKSAITEMFLPFEKPFPDAAYVNGKEAGAKSTGYEEQDWKNWVNNMRDLMKNYGLPENLPVIVQMIEFSPEARLVTLEGESVAGLAREIKSDFNGGVTFALGYSNGYKLYLITSAQQKEGGFERDCDYQFNTPTPVQIGIENHLHDAVKRLKQKINVNR